MGDAGSFVSFLNTYPSIYDPCHTSETVQPTLYSLSYQSASSERYRSIISERLVSPRLNKKTDLTETMIDLSLKGSPSWAIKPDQEIF
jgi:hypothetical protein